MKQQNEKKVNQSFSSDYESEEDDVYEQEYLKKLEQRKTNANFRISVSAEAYGEYNSKKAFKPPVYQKNLDEINKILNILQKSFMFQHLEQKEQKILALAMREVKVQSGEFIIKQGDDGNDIYVVASGELDCTKNIKGEEKFLLTYKQGMAFGELALLYNAPRAASIKGKKESVLYALDRETFNLIVKDAVIKRREIFIKFLSKIALLDTLNLQEKEKICDCLKIENFKSGDYVIKQGEKGEIFYFIKEGTCDATKINNGKEDVVYQYKENDYFGELALLRDEPRAANIIATSNLIVASIDRSSFQRLLGPLEEILKRNTSRYEKFVQNKQVIL